MSLEMDYCTMFQVIDSWERLRRLPDYEKVAGSVLFQNLFQKCPQAKTLFGFPLEMDPRSEKMLKSRRFVMHSIYMIQMLDKALNMLGPDIELLGEILADLGKKHARYGVKEEFFPLMGESLHEMLKEMLKEDYTEKDKAAWDEVYLALSTAMCQTMNKQAAVLESWEKLKRIDNYEEVAGSILFQSLFKKAPDSKTLFGFPIDMDPTSDLMRKSRRFKMHSSYFIGMLDNALKMMEKEKLQESMAHLGEVHSLYGVQPEYFPLMGEALMETLSATLKDDFTSEAKEAWTDIYHTLSSEMIAAMKASHVGPKATRRTTTL